MVRGQIPRVINHRRVFSGLSPEAARPLSATIPSRRGRKRFIKDGDRFLNMIWDNQSSSEQAETRSFKGRNAKRRAYKREKKREAQINKI